MPQEEEQKEAPEETQTLNEEELREAKRLVHERHPLYTLPLTAPLPFIKPCYCTRNSGRGINNPDVFEELLEADPETLSMQDRLRGNMLLRHKTMI